MTTRNFPDRWEIVDFGEKYGEDRYAVFATWLGGYTTGDNWKRSSPIRKIEEIEASYVCTTHSGAEYILQKGYEGTSVWSESILASAGSFLTVVDIKDVVMFLQNLDKESTNEDF